MAAEVSFTVCGLSVHMTCLFLYSVICHFLLSCRNYLYILYQETLSVVTCGFTFHFMTLVQKFKFYCSKDVSIFPSLFVFATCFGSSSLLPTSLRYFTFSSKHFKVFRFVGSLLIYLKLILLCGLI